MTITEAEVRSAISHVIRDYDVASLKLEQEFREAGIDSLDHVMVLLRLKELYKLDIKDEEIDETSSIKAIVAYAVRTPSSM